jgi:hypothetical protein
MHTFCTGANAAAPATREARATIFMVMVNIDFFWYATRDTQQLNDCRCEDTLCDVEFGS